MNDLKYYVDKEGLPDWGLSPDNVYPIVNGEFGIMFVNFYKEINNQLILDDGIELIELKGGVAANSVPDYCKAKVKVNEDKLNYFKEKLDGFIKNGNHRMKLTNEGEIFTIECFGVACHGGTPENGVNAILPLTDFLYGMATEDNSLIDFLKFINNHVGYETNGRRLSIYTEDSSGNTVLNVGICSINTSRAECTINIRFPVMTKGDVILEILEKKIKEYNMGIEIIMNSDSHYVDENSDFIKKLQRIYTEITGKDAKPLSLKGGTYARMLGDKGVAFGPCEVGSDQCGNGHRSDEFVDTNLLFTNAVIYANTILELCKS
jgi:succinyl-diaminopimelate desuccinylase